MSNIDIVHRMFDAVAARNMEDFQSYCEKDYRIWHSFDQIDRTLKQSTIDLLMMGMVMSRIEYTDRDFVDAPDNSVVAQYVCRGETIDGKPVALHVMMRVRFSVRGKIQRVEEYVDSGQCAVIVEAAGMLARNENRQIVAGTGEGSALARWEADAALGREHLALAHAYFDAVAAGDLVAAEILTWPDALIWHSYDQMSKPLVLMTEGLAKMKTVVGELDYKERKYYPIETGVVAQHRLSGFLPSGERLDVPIMLNLHVRGNRLGRIEEYVDLSALTELFALLS